MKNIKLGVGQVYKVKPEFHRDWRNETFEIKAFTKDYFIDEYNREWVLELLELYELV